MQCGDLAGRDVSPASDDERVSRRVSPNDVPDRFLVRSEPERLDVHIHALQRGLASVVFDAASAR